MDETTDTRNIYERIEAAKANFPAIVKGAEGQVGSRTYSYADIDSVVDGVEYHLRAEGVGIFPTVEDTDTPHSAEVVTRLRIIANPGAEPLTCAIPLPRDLTPQQTGSAITNFRRYSLVLLLNLLTEDDDGASASTPPRTRQQAASPAPQPAPEVPVFDAEANGWESDAAAKAAHTALRERILNLPEAFAEQAIAFKETNGWPMSVARFEELEAIVRLGEGLGA